MKSNSISLSAWLSAYIHQLRTPIHLRKYSSRFTALTFTGAGFKNITAAEKLAMGSYAMICGLPRRYIEDIRVNSGSKSVGMVFPEPVPVGIRDPICVPDKAKRPTRVSYFWCGPVPPKPRTFSMR